MDVSTQIKPNRGPFYGEIKPERTLVFWMLKAKADFWSLSGSLLFVKENLTKQAKSSLIHNDTGAFLLQFCSYFQAAKRMDILLISLPVYPHSYQTIKSLVPMNCAEISYNDGWQVSQQVNWVSSSYLINHFSKSYIIKWKCKTFLDYSSCPHHKSN